MCTAASSSTLPGRAPPRSPWRAAAALLPLLLFFLGGVGSERPAQASKPRCRLERLDVVPDSSPTEVRVLASLVELEGDLRTLPPSAFRLDLAGKPLATARQAAPFLKSGMDTYLVLVLETSALYAGAMEQIKEAVGEFLDALPPRTKVKLVLFGNELSEPTGAFSLPGPLRPAIDEIESDDEGEIQLVTGVRAGLRALNNVIGLRAKGAASAPPPKAPAVDPAKPSPRRLIVVLSDGINPTMERKLFRVLGEDLRKSRVPLFPIAFSPRDDRGPLLNLGELAKRSGGTFRWAEKPEVLKERFLSLAEELKQLQVLTFVDKKLDPEKLIAGAVSLHCGEVPSLALSLAGDGQPLPERKSGLWKWLLGLVAVLGGLWVGARLLVWAMDRRVRRLQQRPPLAGPVPAHGASAGHSGYPQPSPHGTLPAQWQAPPQVQAAASAWAAQRPAGASQAAAAPAVTAVPAAASQAAAPPAALRPLLRFVGQSLSGQRVPLPDGGVLLIGKAVSGPGALVITTDPTVSSRHCEIRRLGDAYFFTDLQSTNGSYINDKRVTAPTRLQPGDLIRIGTATECRLVLE